MKHLLITFLSTLFLVGCSTYSEEEINGFDKEIQAYIAKNKLETTRSESGVYYTIIEEGEGKSIQFRDLVSFKYKGTLLDGKVVDEQLKEPVEYHVNELIGAWKEIMLMLKKGGKAFLIAPPTMGYGDHQLADIPANSILVFELEVVDVK